MNGNFDAIGKPVERNVNARAITVHLQNHFAADVSGSLGKLRSRVRLKARMYSLMFHSGTEHAHQTRVLVQVKHHAHALISHRLEPR